MPGSRILFRRRLLLCLYLLNTLLDLLERRFFALDPRLELLEDFLVRLAHGRRRRRRLGRRGWRRGNLRLDHVCFAQTGLRCRPARASVEDGRIHVFGERLSGAALQRRLEEDAVYVLPFAALDIAVVVVNHCGVAVGSRKGSSDDEPQRRWNRCPVRPGAGRDVPFDAIAVLVSERLQELDDFDRIAVARGAAHEPHVELTLERTLLEGLAGDDIRPLEQGPQEIRQIVTCCQTGRQGEENANDADAPHDPLRSFGGLNRRAPFLAAKLSAEQRRVNARTARQACCRPSSMLPVITP